MMVDPVAHLYRCAVQISAPVGADGCAARVPCCVGHRVQSMCSGSGIALRLIESHPSTAVHKNALPVIRFVLLTGSLALGGIAIFLTHDGGPLAPELLDVEAYARTGASVLFLGFFAGVLAMRMKWDAAEGFAARRTYTVVGWALAEAAATAGAVYLLLLGDPLFFAIGFAAQLFISFVLIPPPKQQTP